jgi:plasmid stability protein
MSVQGASVHPKLSDAAMAELKLIAEVRQQSIQAVVEDILHRALLGESHAIKVAMERAVRSGVLGKSR